jgi:hypothetical protein
MMKKFAIVMCALSVLAGFAFGGTETYSSGREMKQTAVQQAPCPEWYRDTEWNVNLWGTYALTGNSWRNDTYLGVDHAWGGGIDAKYFFHRYFGIGLEESPARLSALLPLGIRFPAPDLPLMSSPVVARFSAVAGVRK